MVQRKAFGAALVGLALFLAVATGLVFAAATPIANSKHNLSATGPVTNTIKAATGGTTEICVFCHTPHRTTTSMNAPLWNKAAHTGDIYTLYSSDYLFGVAGVGGLGYPTPVLGATQSSRTCLTCHDGTVALGSVVNTPGSGTTGSIPMAGGITTMPAGNTNLATNLSDDHPVGFLYLPGTGAGQDPELVSTRAFPWPKGVQLDPNRASVSGTPGSGGRVECKSCHDPHNNQFTKFLRMSNTNAGLCKYCHSKTNYDLSAHNISTQAYTPTSGGVASGPATTVGENSCRNCHRPHTGVGTPLLRGAEENTCYNAGCHGSLNPLTGNTTQGAKNIQPEMIKARRHPTADSSGLHKNIFGGETLTQLGSTNRHAECYDCHNPHQVRPAIAKSATEGAGTRRGTSPWTWTDGATSAININAPLRISAALTGAWGVEPITWPTPPTDMATNVVTFVAPAGGDAGYKKVGGIPIPSVTRDALTVEYQVCLKCHSNYVTLPLGVRNLAAEINPGNSSYHGIVPLVGNAVAIVAATQKNNATNFYVNTQTMAQPWGGSTIVTAATTPTAESCRLNPTQANCVTFAASRGRAWCSDCHGSELTPAYPQTSKSTTVPSGPHGSTFTGTGPGTSNADRLLIATIASTGDGTPLCLRCHLIGSYEGGNTGSRFSRHGTASTGNNEGCLACHMWENAAVSTGATGDIFPHGMNRRWATIGTSTSASTGAMVDSFNGGWYTTIDYAGKRCFTQSGGTLASLTGATTPTGSPCGGRSGTY